MPSALNNPFVAIVYLDAQFHVLNTNGLGKDYIHSQSTSTLQGELFSECLIGCDLKKWSDSINESLRTGSTFDLTLQNKSAETHNYSFFAQLSKNKEVTGILLYFVRIDKAKAHSEDVEEKLNLLKKEENHHLDLKLELQMTDIALERKSYELALIRDLLGQIKSLQDYDEIIFIFMKFICEKFLLGHSYFVKLFMESELRGHVAGTFSLMESPSLGGLRQKIYDVIVHNPKFFIGGKKYWKEQIPEPIKEYFFIEGKELTGVLHLPIKFGSEFIGTMQFGHYAPHHGLSANDVEFIGLLLEQIDPFIENSKLFAMSMVDDLTQVFNKRYFRLSMEREFKRSHEFPDLRMNLIMLDIDHFKKVNDSYGHLSGDKVLQEIAKILKGTIRDKDLVCRYGGEEFAILLLEPLKIAQLLADRIMHKLHNTVIEIGDQVNYKATASLGICSFDTNFKTFDQWIERADQCLYEAKKTGRDRIVVDPESLKKEASTT